MGVCAMLIIPVALNGEVVACGAIVRCEKRVDQPEQLHHSLVLSVNINIKQTISIKGGERGRNILMRD